VISYDYTLSSLTCVSFLKRNRFRTTCAHAHSLSTDDARDVLLCSLMCYHCVRDLCLYQVGQFASDASSRQTKVHPVWSKSD
jgi:hypothetical protein